MGKIVETFREAGIFYKDLWKGYVRGISPYLLIFALSNANGVSLSCNEQKIDPLYFTSVGYKINDNFDLDGELDNKYEEKLGVRILGKPTESDLEKLLHFSEKHLGNARDEYQELGIENIIIFSEEDDKKVDYSGKYLGDSVWFFSEKLNEDIFVHELTHAKHAKKRENLLFRAKWETEWKKVAGPYNKVVTIKRRGLVGVICYIDKTDEGSNYGYVWMYGGKNFKEDIATYVEAATTCPYIFAGVTSHFDICNKKLDLLYEVEFITEENYNISKQYLKGAEERSNQKCDIGYK